MYVRNMIVSIAIIIGGCAVYSQQPQGIEQIEFTSQARGGYYKYVRLTADSVTTSVREGRAGEMRTTTQLQKKNAWQQAIESVKGIRLSEIPEMPSPTMKRAH